MDLKDIETFGMDTDTFNKFIDQYLSQFQRASRLQIKVNIMNNLIKLLSENFYMMDGTDTYDILQYAVLKEIIEHGEQFDNADLLTQQLLERNEKDQFFLNKAKDTNDKVVLSYLTNSAGDLDSLDRNLVLQAGAGNVGQVYNVITQGADVTAFNNLALKAAILNHHQDVIDYFEQLGIEDTIDFQDVQEIVDMGVIPNIMGANRAAQSGDVEMLKVILRERPEFAVSLWSDDEETQRLLLRYGQEPTTVKDLLKTPVSESQFLESVYSDVASVGGFVSDEIKSNFGDLQIGKRNKLKVSDMDLLYGNFKEYSEVDELEIFSSHERYLKENICLGFTYCTILYAYSLNTGHRFLNDHLLNNEAVYNIMNLTDLTNKYGEMVYKILDILGLDQTSENYNKGILELGKVVNNIILKSPPLRSNTKLFRGLKRQSDLNIIPLKKGATFINENGIRSMSVSVKSAKDFADLALLTLYIPKGARGLNLVNDCSYYADTEKELTFPHGCEWRVLNFSRDDGVYYITLLLISQPATVSTVCRV